MSSEHHFAERSPAEVHSDESAGRGEHTRQEILDAANCLFLERGYHGTSVRQIAQEAGIALGGIYNHFPSKEAIFTAVLETRHPFFDVLPAMNTAEGETVEEFVQDAARRMIAGMGDRKDFLNLMFIEWAEFNGQHIPHLFNLFFPQVMVFAQRFFGHRGDQLRPIPIAVVIRAFIGLFFSYALTEMLVSQQKSPEFSKDTLEQFIDIYLHGILIEPPAEKSVLETKQ